MGHRLKNSAFRPFLDVLEGKVRDSGAYIGEGIGGVFWSVLVRGNVPGEGSG